MLRLFHRLMDVGWFFRLAQMFGRPTVRRYETLIRKHVPRAADRRILEIGCGIGASRPLFAGDYTGIDINPDYIRIARQTLSGTFEIMDASQLAFGPDSFDDAVSIATGHHLSDDQLAAMVRQATSVAATLHIIDSILPVSPSAHFKRALFRMDRGRHVRTFDQLRAVVTRNAQIHESEVLTGPLHDVCYICATPASPSAGAMPIDRGDEQHVGQRRGRARTQR
jgi:SAM-dependent methyltransferase